MSQVFTLKDTIEGRELTQDEAMAAVGAVLEQYNYLSANAPDDMKLRKRLAAYVGVTLDVDEDTLKANPEGAYPVAGVIILYPLLHSTVVNAKTGKPFKEGSVANEAIPAVLFVMSANGRYVQDVLNSVAELKVDVDGKGIALLMMTVWANLPKRVSATVPEIHPEDKKNLSYLLYRLSAAIAEPKVKHTAKN
jgi:hypothetical protein